ncbi:phenylacetate--CoA ligase family protein [Brevibacillus brevis]|uniref:phenylacetate--CoA ligase family protein n=1 Tax=Brevibacillus brevis TaxID=1393 RepID=UPI000D0FCE48|nr:phenylacetate--CoA ligase family protein [Brevibacillus brevis]PSJ64648.1 CoF synthetase [Brevibacillus brevis]RED32864.1 phenylacetate-CoA ligase [Brevibacillus brevis]GEC91162.1 adenylyltransferase [Brevibacillus brevis]VEF90537.1 Phenylacetate-coenzyme A ligase [Brevibacillus brevis]
MPTTGFLIRHVQWPLMEALKGNRIRPYMKELQAAEHLSAEALNVQQREKLVKLLDHATQNVPAYTAFAPDWSKMREMPERFLQRIPVLTKTHFRQNADQYMSQGLQTKSLIANRTGGSTGEPTHFYLDRLTVERYEAARWLGLSWYGIRIGDPCVMIWGSPLELDAQQARRYRWKERWLKNRMMISAYELDERHLEANVRLIREFRPAYLYGYASALYTLATMMRRRGMTLGIPLKAVVSTAESLHEHQRQMIAQAFDAPVVNEYGARDGGIIAYQCKAGSMHAFSWNCYLEVVDPITHIPVHKGHPGALLVTDLHNTVMPRLRYQLGDVVALSDSACSCNLPFPLLASIDGREDDMFLSLNGQYVHGHYFNHIVRNMDSFRTFQLVQHEPERLSLRLVKEPERFLPADEAKLLAGIRAALGQVSIHVSYVETIPPASSGKTRYAIREFPLTSALPLE